MKKKNMIKKKSNNWLMFGAILVVGIIAALSVMNFGEQQTPPPVSTIQGDFQTVELKVQGANYILTPSELKKDVPVRMVADMDSVRGCARSIIIPEFGVRKQVAGINNVIEFTPTKAGTFNIMCSMNMYTGVFTVVEADGTKSDYVEQAPAAASGSCGGSGGCGCGGGSLAPEEPVITPKTVTGGCHLEV